jgi:cytochrome c-type biogenesis protein
MVADVSLLAAFVAGILSISSPCVLPLIPIYLTHIAGVTVGEGHATRGVVMRNAVAFVLGFAIVFIAFGAALGAAGAAAGGLEFLSTNRVWLVRFGGILMIVLGLYQVGVIPLPLLDRERRLSFSGGTPGTIGSSLLVGVTFGAGWSPCVGPIQGAILTMAAGQGSIERASLLLTAYALGLGIPFLAMAFGFGSVSSLMRRVNGQLGLISTLSGAIMLGVGVIMLLGLYELLFAEIVRVAPWTPWEPTI